MKVCRSEKRKSEIFSSRFSVFWRREIRGLNITVNQASRLAIEFEQNIRFGSKIRTLIHFSVKVCKDFFLLLNMGAKMKIEKDILIFTQKQNSQIL